VVVVVVVVVVVGVVLVVAVVVVKRQTETHAPRPSSSSSSSSIPQRSTTTTTTKMRAPLPRRTCRDSFDEKAASRQSPNERQSCLLWSRGKAAAHRRTKGKVVSNSSNTAVKVVGLGHSTHTHNTERRWWRFGAEEKRQPTAERKAKLFASSLTPVEYFFTSTLFLLKSKVAKHHGVRQQRMGYFEHKEAIRVGLSEATNQSRS
jgi:hypothetical protein